MLLITYILQFLSYRFRLPLHASNSHLLQRYFRDVTLLVIVTEIALSGMAVALAAILDQNCAVHLYLH